MPTLMCPPESQAGDSNIASASRNDRIAHDGESSSSSSTSIYDSDESTIIDDDYTHNNGVSTTSDPKKDGKVDESEILSSPTSAKIFNSDESTIVDELHANNNSENNKTNAITDSKTNFCEIQSPPSRSEKNNKSVTFDDSMILLSAGKKGRYSRRDTLNSDVSLLSCNTTFAKDRTIISTKSLNDHSYDQQMREDRGSPYSRSDRVQTWPRRDEYNEKYQPYVKNAISDFKSKFPEKLRDYRCMSSEEKAVEQQKVLALLTRLGVSKNDFGSKSIASPSVHGHGCFKSPCMGTTNRLIDDSFSPMFSPNARKSECDDVNLPLSPLNKENKEENSVSLHQSQIPSEKSELLLSIDNEDQSNMGSHDRGGGEVNDHSAYNHSSPENEDSELDFQVNNDDQDSTSNSSMELVRQASSDDPYYSDKRVSCMTPDRSGNSKTSSRKRVASNSGKRGADSRRSRHNDHEDEDDYRNHWEMNDVELSQRLGRLSISPSSPKDLFITQQSPISPRLTYNSAGDNESDDCGDGYSMNRISLGRDSDDHRKSTRRDYRRDSNITTDSVGTNTPPKRYQSEKDKRRAFREVPVNVVLKKGATFHLEKIAVKRTERISSKSAMPKNRKIKTMQRRRLVNFPDPLVRYGSRRRRALKEMYSWIKTAELEYEEGKCAVPAVGAFFSLSEQQIIDVSLKLLLSDYAERLYKDVSQTGQFSSVLKGKTLVVLRTKDETANWENSLREGTGCSVLNHSSLQLSERIRASTAEKACLYDVVLTTFDSIKSPDVTIPLTNDGRAILTKSQNDKGWLSSRSATQQDQSIRQETKQFCVLHRIEFKRIIFVDSLGRKCYLAKSNTARANASVAVRSSSCRLVFFKETEADGANALLALRKSDKRAFRSVSSALHLTDITNDSYIDNDSSDDDDNREDPLETIAMDLKDLIC